MNTTDAAAAPTPMTGVEGGDVLTLDELWVLLARCPRSAWYWAGLAYRAGRLGGRAELWAAIGRAGEDVRHAARPFLGQPSYAELRVRRGTPRPCSCDRCSACVRHAAVEANRARYGTDDRPGTDQATRRERPPATHEHRPAA
jgi:hypothetical protein